jgi:hypothetical protein
MRAVILSFDRLPCSALGCYGNEWVETQHFDRLAAEGFVCDAHVVGTQVRNPWVKPTADWLEQLAQRGVCCTLWHEDRCPPFLFERLPFAERQRFTGDDLSLQNWPFANLIAAVLRRWEQPPSSEHELFWLHAAGIPVPCQVPAEVATLYVDEFAERGVDWSQLAPEERAVHPATQAAYVSCIDHFFGQLLAAAKHGANQEPVLIVVTARLGGVWQSIPRRFPLPEALEIQQMRTPLLWWTGTRSDSASSAASHAAARRILPGRSLALVQPTDLGPTIWQWFVSDGGLAESDGSLWPVFEGTTPRLRTAAVVEHGALWTEHDVTLFPDPMGDPSLVRRFLWPEDVWQVNDVAGLSPELVAERLGTWQQRDTAAHGG